MRKYILALTTVALFTQCGEKKSQTLAADKQTQNTEVAPIPENIEIPQGMALIPGGSYTMGSSSEYAEKHEGPEVTVTVDGFLMDKTEVTNAQFKKFVDETGYITVAERPINWEELKKSLPPGTPKPADSLLAPGSLVFTPPNQAVSLSNYYAWWSWVKGADWQHPEGPESSIAGKDNHPVVQIAYEDAQAYAKWSGKRLPTEAEWEFASRGGAGKSQFIWGDELTPNGKYLANFFQGDFPHANNSEDGFAGSAPITSFPANNYGLYDMIGNVWEWTTDYYRPDTKELYAADAKLCKNPTGPESSYDPTDPYADQKRVIKGGSFLCSEQYCSNYRPSSRMATSTDSGQNHLGFRCVKDITPTTP